MSEADPQVVALLIELRDTQREHLAVYRQLAQRALDAQQAAIDLSRGTVRLYRIVVAVSAVIVVGMITYYLYLTY